MKSTRPEHDAISPLLACIQRLEQELGLLLQWFRDDRSDTYGDRRLASAAASVREALERLREIRAGRT